MTLPTASPGAMTPPPDAPIPRASTNVGTAPARPALRRLFLTLFLRGRSARGLRKKRAPQSIAQKLGLTLGVYLAFGILAASFVRQPIFVLAIYLHALTFVLLGMMIASSVGEMLFNKDKADILLHRPIEPRALLWAKIRVLLEAALWLAVAFNLVGLFVGLTAPDGGWRFIPVHLLSILLEAVFTAGCVVAAYQLCLRLFGRERLESFMTLTQVVVAISAALSGQILPHLIYQGHGHTLMMGHSPWLAFLPPAWFAGLDDELAGSMRRGALGLTATAVFATVAIAWIAFGKLARDYQLGVQRLSEAVSPSNGVRARRRWINSLVDLPVIRWWLADPTTRASFLLSAAYLSRDRDVKLRIYPAIAPIMVLPAIFLFQSHGEHGLREVFSIAMAGNWISMLPFVGLNLLQYSQQWQASDIFRAAPMPGPGPLCHGAQRAMLCFLAVPMVLLSVGLVWLAGSDAKQLLLLLPGIVALPVFAAMASFLGGAIPLSRPTEDARGANRGMMMMLVMLISTALAGVVAMAWYFSWFRWLIVVEVIVCAAACGGCRVAMSRMRWPSTE
jgi:ABC-2 type transport system permease protein